MLRMILVAIWFIVSLFEIRNSPKIIISYNSTSLLTYNEQYAESFCKSLMFQSSHLVYTIMHKEQFLMLMNYCVRTMPIGSREIFVYRQLVYSAEMNLMQEAISALGIYHTMKYTLRNQIIRQDQKNEKANITVVLYVRKSSSQIKTDNIKQQYFGKSIVDYDKSIRIKILWEDYFTFDKGLRFEKCPNRFEFENLKAQNNLFVNLTEIQGNLKCFQLSDTKQKTQSDENKIKSQSHQENTNKIQRSKAKAQNRKKGTNKKHSNKNRAKNLKNKSKL